MATRLLLVLLLGAAAARAQEPPKVRIDPAKLRRISDRHKLAGVSVVTAAGVERFARLADLGAKDLDRGSLLVASLDEAVAWKKVGNDLKCTLPIRFGTVDSDLADLPLELSVLIDGGAVEYRPSERRYAGGLRIAVENPDAPGAKPLPRAVTCELTVDSMTVAPDRVVLKSTNRFERVAAEAPSLTGDQVVLHVLPEFAEGQDLDVAIRRPVVTIDASPASVQGFGLQPCRITVSVSAAHTKAIGRVDLGASAGTLSPSEVQIDPVKGTGSTTLYTYGKGPVDIRVLQADLATKGGHVDVRIPWAFLIAALLGGLAGAFWAWLKAAPKPGLGGTLLKYGLLGLFAGLLLPFGVNLVGRGFGLDFAALYASRGYSEVVVFLAAALAGWGAGPSSGPPDAGGGGSPPGSGTGG